MSPEKLHRLGACATPGTRSIVETPVITRTTSRIVTFSRPFQLAGMDEEQPAGSYCIETDDEPLPTTFTSHRRIETRIRLSLARGTYASQSVPIDPQELEAALVQDAQAAGDAVAIDADETAAEPSASARMRACDAIRQAHRSAAARIGLRRRGST